MSQYTIYHNPRCSKSRQTLQLLEDANVDVNIVEYLKTPLNKEQLIELGQLLNVEPLAMMRPKEAEFKELGLSKDSSADALLDGMVKAPKLIERPIVVHGDKACIGRPPENVLALIEQ
ncbi:arsenate reductase (glutaredoxin) [Thalassotalea sp. PS06]|uniref:arsenate reductase (glutaredoxin) n=1 Tax=Thalassotalea sp. PS06 TaxID=2594005 RepID=UPI0011622C58|nr:arsenate reductase (glutaredoxin) [Thalassotalea sp. PS06]QDP01485.1 arsenate reductase (glutaredoxin) [Thalassotalea sp. PS06]